MLTTESSRASWLLRHRWPALVLATFACFIVAAIAAMPRQAGLTAPANAVNRGADEPPPDFFPRPSAAEVKILAALEQPMTIEFVQTALGDFVEFLRKTTGCNVILDRVALQQEGVHDDSQINAKVNDIRLASALQLVLKPLNITYLVDHDVLEITSIADASIRTRTRTYPVGDLCQTPEDYDELMDAIRSAVDNSSWQENGGTCSMTRVQSAGSLVVSQTSVNHDKLVELIRSLREAKRLMQQ